MTITSGTPYQCTSRDSASWAVTSFFIGKAQVQPYTVQNICTAVFPYLDLILEYIVSVNNVMGKRWYLMCPSFVIFLLLRLR
jgi:hypothetical protein